MKNNKKINYVIILVIYLVTVLSFSFKVLAAGTTNVTILYGWNGSEFAPMQIDSDGALKTTLNLTQSVGLFPTDHVFYPGLG